MMADVSLKRQENAQNKDEKAKPSKTKRKLIILAGIVSLLLLLGLRISVQQLKSYPVIFAEVPVNSSEAAFVDRSNDDSSFISWMEQEHDRQQSEMARSKEIIQDWMAKYLIWHGEQRKKLLNNTGNDIKYLVVRCLNGEKCGGLSDRLKPMPFFLMLAATTQRVLLIHWKKPTDLEHFLIPPLNGLDWRVEGTHVTIDEIRNKTNFQRGALSQDVLKMKDEPLAQARVLSICLNSGTQIQNANALFNRWLKQPNQRPARGFAYLGWNGTIVNDHDLFEDVWRLLFKPSPNVLREIYKTISELDIIGNEFNSANVRAKHPKIIPTAVAKDWLQQHHPGKNFTEFEIYEAKTRIDMKENITFTDKMKSHYFQLYSNAVACANQLAPGLPVYLSSDSDNLASMMQNVSIVRLPSSVGDAKALHIDNDYDQGLHPPSSFYLIFVDLYIMSKAKCLSHSGSGFGILPLRISGSMCELTHVEHVCQAMNETR